MPTSRNTSSQSWISATLVLPQGRTTGNRKGTKHVTEACTFCRMRRKRCQVKEPCPPCQNTGSECHHKRCTHCFSRGRVTCERTGVDKRKQANRISTRANNDSLQAANTIASVSGVSVGASWHMMLPSVVIQSNTAPGQQRQRSRSDADLTTTALQQSYMEQHANLSYADTPTTATFYASTPAHMPTTTTGWRFSAAMTSSEEAPTTQETLNASLEQPVGYNPTASYDPTSDLMDNFDYSGSPFSATQSSTSVPQQDWWTATFTMTSD